MSEQTISADKLCALTGLTDRRHRQIADQGFFPPPTRGQYLLTQTISGMFRYYREAYQRATQSLVEDKQIKMKREIELLDLKIAEQNKRLVPLSLVFQMWSGITNAIRQNIISSDIPEHIKRDLLEKCRNIDPDEYCPAEDIESGEDSTSDDAVDDAANGIAVGG